MLLYYQTRVISEGDNVWVYSCECFRLSYLINNLNVLLHHGHSFSAGPISLLPETTLIMNRPERFNAKARRNSAVASSHKRGKNRSSSSSGKQPAVDTNVDIVERKSIEEKELSRREELKQEVSDNPRYYFSAHLQQLLAQSQSKASSKKRKRLDKYIVRTLRPVPSKSLIVHVDCSGEKVKEGRTCRVIRKTRVSE